MAEVRNSNAQPALIFNMKGSVARILNAKNEKGSSISARALKMAGVERFELPTRGFGIGGFAALIT
ncbi:hypothetical protein ASV53_03030 [Photobacterium sanguinicancri]|uniref:Uncharacterized protein n=1 Tax=Photobacterium sanguinicancri TaxID=875932 RepID=A0ABX4G714_9GAMM|nr:hypothetical protein ASV53_03030 [Photobacterium sanguinicancri]